MVSIVGGVAEASRAIAPLAAAALAVASLSEAAALAAASAARLYLLCEIMTDDAAPINEPRLHHKRIGACDLHHGL